jgi:glucose-1-phosphate thymidylyltransferase
MVSKAVLFASADAQTPVGNKPLVLHALEDLADADIREVAVVAPAPVANEVREIVEADRSSCGATTHVIEPGCAFLDALGDLASFLGVDPFAVHLGDSLSRTGLRQAIQCFRLTGNDALALVETNDIRVRPLGNSLAHLRAAGVYVFGPGLLDLAPEAEARDDLDLEIAAATDRLAAAGGRVETWPVDDWWRHRPHPDTMLQANRFFLSALRPVRVDARMENTDLQGSVVVDRSARLTSSLARGPVIIGAGVEITDAYIGPYTSVGPGVVVENAEVENSILLPGASIRHIGGRLEASIVGRQARVFRDFRLPRAFRLTVGDGAEVALT